MDLGSLTIIHIEKEEVKLLQFKRIEKTLRVLKKVGKKARNSLLITFSGYDDIPDEIYEIPEIRRWVAKLVKRNPEVFYFLNRELEGSQIILATLCDLTSFYVGEPTKSPLEYYESGIDPTDLPKKTVELTISDELKEHIIKGVTDYAKKINDIDGARSSLAIFDIFKNKH